MEERSCNLTSTDSSTPTLPDPSHTTLTPSAVTESKVGDSTDQFDQHVNSDHTNSRDEPYKNSKSFCSKSIQQSDPVGASIVQEPTNIKESEVQATSLTTMRASTSGNPKESMKPQASLKNDTPQQSRGTSQSPVISSTVTTQVSSTPQASVVPETQSGNEGKAYIPRLIDGPVKDGSKVQPKLWTPEDVAQFLKTNDCGAYCDNFVSQVCLV